MAGGTGDDRISGFGAGDELIGGTGRNELDGGANRDDCEERIFSQLRNCP
jgi:Ca2+-binding RTX toxin-like protein